MNTLTLRAMRDEIEKISSDLTEAARAKLPKKDFAVGPKSSNTGEEAYPIPDRQHAKSALGFAKMHGDSADLEKVRAKVKSKYPDMLKSAADLSRFYPGTEGYHSRQMHAALSRLPAHFYLAEEKRAAIAQAVRGAMKGEIANHLAELGGLGVLAVPSVDELQAHARASMAGEYNKEDVKRREMLPAIAKPAAEAAGLGTLMVPEGLHLLGKLRGAGEGMVA